MTDNLENTAVDTAPVAETEAEQGTVVENTGTAEAETAQEGVQDKEAQKAEMRRNQLENIESQARELEETTGLSLEDLLGAAKGGDPVAEEMVEAMGGSEDLTDLVETTIQAKYGDKLSRLEKLDQKFARLEAKEQVAKLPSDYKSLEKDMTKFLEENPTIARLDNAATIAYNYAKGQSAEKSAKESAREIETKKLEKEEVKETSFIEGAKSGKESTPSKADLANISTKEWATLPKDVRERILRSLG